MAPAGLIAAGEPVLSPCVQRAMHFLLSKQNPNGGWGENYLACVNKAYTDEGTGDTVRFTLRSPPPLSSYEKVVPDTYAN